MTQFPPAQQPPSQPTTYGVNPVGDGLSQGGYGMQVPAPQPPPTAGQPGAWSGVVGGGTAPDLGPESLVIRSTATTSARLTTGVVLATGAVFVAAAVVAMVQGMNSVPVNIGLLALGLLIVGMAGLAASSSTVLDASGIHVGHALGRRDLAWPASRTGFFGRVHLASGKARMVANSVDVCLVTPERQAVRLSGLSWTGPSIPGLESKAVAECSRIWAWAVARGYTRETGEYVELRGLGVQQGLRAAQESRWGLH